MQLNSKTPIFMPFWVAELLNRHGQGLDTCLDLVKLADYIPTLDIAAMAELNRKDMIELLVGKLPEEMEYVSDTWYWNSTSNGVPILVEPRENSDAGKSSWGWLKTKSDDYNQETDRIVDSVNAILDTKGSKELLLEKLFNGIETASGSSHEWYADNTPADLNGLIRSKEHAEAYIVKLHERYSKPFTVHDISRDYFVIVIYPGYYANKTYSLRSVDSENLLYRLQLDTLRSLLKLCQSYVPPYEVAKTFWFTQYLNMLQVRRMVI